MTEHEFTELIKQERRKHREAVNAFVQAALSGDLERFCSALELVEENCLWTPAFRALCGKELPIELRTRFVSIC